ncbi:MAG: hypothetical protein WAS56_13960, partial [Saprospiraceae bacterium]
MKNNVKNRRIISIFLLFILNFNLCESAALIFVEIENLNNNSLKVNDQCDEDLINFDECLQKDEEPIKANIDHSKKSIKKLKADKLEHGGPSMPEASAFTSTSSGNLVNLATGDFNYSIPLLDVGGYPINLNYDSQVGLNDEASWVGLGWSLNAGSVNRSVRGLPDDFKDVEI